MSCFILARLIKENRTQMLLLDTLEARALKMRCMYSRIKIICTCFFDVEYFYIVLFFFYIYIYIYICIYSVHASNVSAIWCILYVLVIIEK